MLLCSESPSRAIRVRYMVPLSRSANQPCASQGPHYPYAPSTGGPVDVAGISAPSREFWATSNKAAYQRLPESRGWGRSYASKAPRIEISSHSGYLMKVGRWYTNDFMVVFTKNRWTKALLQLTYNYLKWLPFEHSVIYSQV